MYVYVCVCLDTGVAICNIVVLMLYQFLILRTRKELIRIGVGVGGGRGWVGVGWRQSYPFAVGRRPVGLVSLIISIPGNMQYGLHPIKGILSWVLWKSKLILRRVGLHSHVFVLRRVTRRTMCLRPLRLCVKNAVTGPTVRDRRIWNWRNWAPLSVLIIAMTGANVWTVGRSTVLYDNSLNIIYYRTRTQRIQNKYRKWHGSRN